MGVLYAIVSPRFSDTRHADGCNEYVRGRSTFSLAAETPRPDKVLLELIEKSLSLAHLEYHMAAPYRARGRFYCEAPIFLRVRHCHLWSFFSIIVCLRTTPLTLSCMPEFDTLESRSRESSNNGSAFTAKSTLSRGNALRGLTEKGASTYYRIVNSMFAHVELVFHCSSLDNSVMF